MKFFILTLQLEKESGMAEWLIHTQDQSSQGLWYTLEGTIKERERERERESSIISITVKKNVLHSVILDRKYIYSLS